VKREELIRGDNGVSTATGTGTNGASNGDLAVIFYEMSFLKTSREQNKYFNLKYSLTVLCILKYFNFKKL
jgi:hypothetical protein